MYAMSCYTNVEHILKSNNFLFFDASPAEGNIRAGEIGIPHKTAHRECVGWSETTTPNVVELTDYMTGKIYYLLGDIQDAEAMALTVALSYA